jgi:ribonuclease J
MPLPYNAVNIPITQPPELVENTLRIVPLGGLGDVGRNCSVLELIDPIAGGAPRLLMLDCGVLFPGDDEPGVDLILPDFTYISERLDCIDALVVTHGHEDHIGAIPYLLKLRPDIPVVGSAFTIALITKKLKYHRITPNAKIVSAGDCLRFGPFLLNFLPVNHSIPDALAVYVKTGAGNVLDTGDFKMDQRPLDGRLTDLGKFADAGEEGVDVLMVDSTNACVPGFVMSETDIGTEIEKIFAYHTSGMIYGSTFASHIHRIQHFVKSARKYGRKVAFLGRTMVNNTKIAQELNKLNLPDDLVIDSDDIISYPREKVAVICTGSQGEVSAALNRLATDTHPVLTLEENDTVIMASSVIPGNEKSISTLVNRMLVSGATVYTSANAKIHSSGHACQGELEYLYNVVRPKNVLPIHGETRHLLTNAGLARRSGLTEQNTPTVLDGGVVDLRDHAVEVVGRIENGYVFVDGKQVGMVSDEDLKHRRILSEEGFVAVSCVVDLQAKKVLAKPKIVARAVAEDDAVFYELAHKVKHALEKAMQKDGVTQVAGLAKVAQRTVGKYVGTQLRRSPLILPLVTAASAEVQTN